MPYEARFWGRDLLGEILSDIADAVFWGPRSGGIRAGSVKREAVSGTTRGAHPRYPWGVRRGDKGKYTL